MDIKWHGLSCFSFEGKSGTVVTDPYDHTHAGIKMPKLPADLCLSNADFELHHATGMLPKEVKIFDWPGEYEAKGIIVQGISGFDRPREKDDSKKDTAQRVIVYSIEIDGFRICHLSNLGHKLTPEMLEAVGTVDILLVPVGGKNCLSAEKAHEVIEQIDPRVVIPMYYKVPGLKIDVDGLEKFTKEVGIAAGNAEKVVKFQSRSNLPQENTEFKILEPVLG